MQQQLPQVPFLDTGNPDPGKTFLQQQAQDQPGIALIMLLLPPVLLPDFRRISHPHLVPQLLQQTLEPVRAPRGFHSHHPGTMQSLVELLHLALAFTMR